MDEELILKLQESHGQSKEVEEKINLVDQHINDLTNFEKSINELESTKESEILASVGKGVYIKSEIKERKLFVDVGSGILVRKEVGEAKDIVGKQIKKLIEMKQDLSMQFSALDEEMKLLMGQIDIKK
jgi:prefoldin alpha subunit